MPRDFATDAALRPQPTTRPARTIGRHRRACAPRLVRDVLPTLPAGPVWEPAPGAGVLADAIAASGRSVVATTDDF